jgi:hypothetical protein
MTCPNCGQPTREGASFCGECGHTLAPAVAGLIPDDAPVAAAPLRRPPPPPEDKPAVAVAAPVVEASAVPDVAPLLVPPPPPAGVPKQVEVVPFGSTEEVEVKSRAGAGDLISEPPGIGDPPSAGPSPADPTPVDAAPAAAPVTPVPESMDETRVSVRRRAGAHWRLVLPDGRHVEVATAILLGRDPSANVKWPGAAKLPVDDETHSISKTHAVIELDGGDLWITDLDSTNGVLITQPDGTELDPESNVRTRIQPGADVELGDYIIQVEKD